MKSKKPFFSRELIYNNIKRFWWVAVLYTLALFLVSPLVTLTNGSDTIPKSGYNIYFADIFEGTIIFLFTIPVFIAVMMFRYMQNSKSMIAMHAMPYTRLRLYVNNIISGLSLLLLPILLNSAFLSVIQMWNLGGTYFKEGIVLKYLGVSAITSVTLYIWTIFIGMFTGSSVAQIIFTYISNFLLVGFVAVGQMLLRGILYGFVANEEIAIKFLQISPLAQILMFDGGIRPDELNYFIIADAIICIVGLIAGYFIYKYRNLETAGDVISGKYVKPIFKYGVTTCAMLVGAVYVTEIFGLDSIGIHIYLLFALLGYIVAEMLLRKSFKIWDSYKGFIYFVIAFAIIAFGIKSDIFGYEKYVPDIENIKAAALNGYVDFSNSTPENPQARILYEKNNIENIVKLHNKLIEDKNINLEEDWQYGDNINISYELDNGKVIRRNYHFEAGKYRDFVNAIYDSEEYIKSTNGIFDYTIDEIYSAKISNAVLGGDSYVSISDKEQINLLFEAMKEDMLNVKTVDKEGYRNIYRIELVVKKKASEVQNATIEYSTIEYVVSEKQQDSSIISARFNKKAENVNKFIEDNGYHDQLQGGDEIVEMIMRYDDKSEDIRIIDSKDKIKKVMNEIYNTPSSKGRYGECISISMDMGRGNVSWTEVDLVDADKIISYFEED